MTPEAFDNMIRFSDSSFGPMHCGGARVATVLDPVCGRESQP